MPKHRAENGTDESDYDEGTAKRKKKVSKVSASKKKPKKNESESESAEPAKEKKAATEKAKKAPPTVKEDKKDFMPGQKYQMPEEEDGARAFYASLFEQNPNSEIAKRYCMQYGLLEPDIAPKIFKELNRK